MIFSYLVAIRAEHGEEFSGFSGGDYTLSVLHLPVEMDLKVVAELVRQYDCTESAPKEHPDDYDNDDRFTAHGMYTAGDWFCQAWGPSTVHQDAEPFTLRGVTHSEITIQTALDLGWFWEGYCDECKRELEDSYGRLCNECDEEWGDPLKEAA